MKEENFKPTVKIHAEHTFGDDGPEAVDIEASGAVIIGLCDNGTHFEAEMYAMGEVDYRAVIVALVRGVSKTLGPEKTTALMLIADREAKKLTKEAQA